MTKRLESGIVGLNPSCVMPEIYPARFRFCIHFCKSWVGFDGFPFSAWHRDYSDVSFFSVNYNYSSDAFLPFKFRPKSFDADSKDIRDIKFVKRQK